MPTYDYKCIEGHIQTISHGFVNEPEIFCGKCSARMRKVYSAPQIQFNGKGFYTTQWKDKINESK